MDRDAFDAKLKEQNLDDETYISLLAAYDGGAAYGDGAIAAWDLSRVGTLWAWVMQPVIAHMKTQWTKFWRRQK